MGNLDDDPYREHVLYDLEYAHHDEDVGWYVQLCSALPSGTSALRPILELGCGTGRLTLPIARAGATMLGVDRAPSMLEGLRRKLASEAAEVRQRVRLIEADYLRSQDALSTSAPFAAVLWPFNALHHCAGPEQLAAMLAQIRPWIAEGGFLALDCYLPDLDLYDRDPKARYEPRTFEDPRSGEVLESWEQGWWDAERRIHHVLYVYEHPDGSQERTQLSLRMYELPELQSLVADAGYRVERSAMDFEGSPVMPGALKWVALLRP
ncbi:MAG: class I SAM-dependent methyltransferase [Myxococcales bacterium]|nr:class I SAM-dependent methyltransferase [Myxococcales bacterium]